MKVTIDLTEDEAVSLRYWRRNGLPSQVPRDVADRVFEALPTEPLKVGDRVSVDRMQPSELGPAWIIAINGNRAWIGWKPDYSQIRKLDELRRIDAS